MESSTLQIKTAGALPGLKQFRNEGCLSYLIFDRAALDAVVIDPRVDLMDDYRDYVARHGLKPMLAVDTHIHADHFSGSHLFRSEYGAEIGMSHRTASARPGRRLRHGDRLRVGGLELEVLETPGHTPDSVSLRGPGLVFTGDALLIGSSGRTDFPGADPGALWDSLRRVLGQLPPSTLIFPSHDYNDLLFSTLEIESRGNPHWLFPGRTEFVAFKSSESIPHLTEEVRKRLEFNQTAFPAGWDGEGAGNVTPCGIPSPGPDRIATISVEKYAHKLKERAPGTLFLDVREQDEYREGHMPGAKNIPLSEVGLYLEEFASAKRIYISCLSGRRSSWAARTLSHLGLPDVVNVVGGYKAWQNAGLPSEK